MENLIGRKARGFRFTDRTGCAFVGAMEEKVGEIGTIDKHDKKTNECRIVFSDDDFWWYPAEEIEKHLVDPIDQIEELGDGVLMEVDDYKDFRNPVKRLVFGKKNGMYLAWLDGEIGGAVYTWHYARPIKEEEEEEIGYPEQVTVNMEEAKRIIAEAKGVNNVNIIS